MSQADQALAEVVYHMCVDHQFRTTPEGTAILANVWGQTVGPFLASAEADGLRPWDNPKLKGFVMRWAAHIAQDTVAAAAVRVRATGDEVGRALTAGITSAHDECGKLLAAGGQPADPVTYALHGPFCTRYLETRK